MVPAPTTAGRTGPGRTGPGRGGQNQGISRERPLARRPLAEPSAARLSLAHPRRAEILATHLAALEAGQAGYPDPDTGAFVFTAARLAATGECCGSGCRHCPWEP